MNQGKFVITAMVAVGLAMAIFAWWARYSASQRVLERFGPTVAVAVRNGDRVELLGLSRDVGDSAVEVESIRCPARDGKTSVYVTDKRDISEAAGLIHARHHLLHDKGFEWDIDSVPANADPNWSVALRFIHGAGTATWVFDFQRQRAYIVERQTEIGMGPIAPSLQTFINGL